MKKADLIKEKLQKALSPERLEVVNDSARHAGHAGDDGSGESHFKLLIVSPAFEGLNRLARHRRIYEVLENEMPEIHALNIKALTPSEKQ